LIGSDTWKMMREAIHAHSCGGGATPGRVHCRGTLCVCLCRDTRKNSSVHCSCTEFIFLTSSYDSIIKKPDWRHVESDNIVFGRTVLQAPTNKSWHAAKIYCTRTHVIPTIRTIRTVVVGSRFVFGAADGV